MIGRVDLFKSKTEVCGGRVGTMKKSRFRPRRENEGNPGSGFGPHQNGHAQVEEARSVRVSHDENSHDINYDNDNTATARMISITTTTTSKKSEFGFKALNHDTLPCAKTNLIVQSVCVIPS